MVYRRAAKSTFLVERPGLTPKVLRFGKATDEPVVGDWDGDGRANPGLRAPGRTVFRLRAAGAVTRVAFGAAEDRAGGGRLGRRRAAGRSASGSPTASSCCGARTARPPSVALGDRDDLPVTGDWDGDRRTDLGVYDQATATFTLRVVDEEGLAWTRAGAVRRARRPAGHR